MGISTQQLIKESTYFLLPLVTAFNSPANFSLLLRRVGIDQAADTLDSAMDVVSPLKESIIGVYNIFSELQDGENIEGAELLDLLQNISDLYDSLRNLNSDLSSLSLPDSFFEELLNLLVADYLFRYHPALYATMRLLGVMDPQEITDDERDLHYVRYNVVWSRIPQFLSDPAEAMAEIYGWGTQEFNSNLLLYRIGYLFNAIQLYTRYGAMDETLISTFYPSAASDRYPPIYTQLPIYKSETEDSDGLIITAEAGLAAMPIEGTSGDNDDGIGLMPYVEGTVTTSIPLNEDGTLTLGFEADADIHGGVVFAMRPQSGLDVEQLLSVSPSIQFELRKAPPTDQEAIVLLGDSEGTRLQADILSLSCGGANNDFFIAGGAEGLTAILDVSEDGLLSKIISGPITVEAGDILAGWRLGRGIYFEQGAGLAVTIPLNVELGPVRLHEIGVERMFESNPTITAWFSGDATIGPLFLGVEGLGIKAIITPNENGGSFGNFDFDLAPKFPTGYAAYLDGGAIKGGGALFKEENEYRGALALQFQNFGLSAFAILTTELPDGEDGFSFLASLFGEFNIALGYGFFLTGLGGLIGINRTTVIEELQNTLSEGRLDNLLFPSDPIQDASIILEDMATIFPAQEGQYLFGPMARIGWGVPTLIEGKVGVVLELGEEIRLIILGSVGTALPVPNAALVVLNVDFLGTIDFDIGAISFDATLIGSRILTWGISGEMALRTGWGQSAGLVASAGGLHPQYPTPANFPDLQRLTINFGTNNPSLTLTAYMAVTLNSVQAGAEISLYAKGPKIPLIGQAEVEGWAGFDVLIMFNPFEFDAALSLGLKLLIDGDTVCGIGGDLRLTGPNSYYISGKVWVTVLGVDVNVPIEHRWGSKNTQDTLTADGVAVLQDAIENSQGWEPVAPTTRVSGVTFKIEETEEENASIDPTGGLRFSQNALPLNTTIEKIGNAQLTNSYNKFDLAVSDIDGDSLDVGIAKNDFIKGHYFELSESEKLRTAVSEKYKSGIEFDSGNDFLYDSNTAEDIDYEYETIFLDDDEDDAKILNTTTVLKGDMATQWFGKTLKSTTTPLNTGYIAPSLIDMTIHVKENEYAAVTTKINKNNNPKVAVEDGEVLAGQFADIKIMPVENYRIVRAHLSTP